LLGELAETLERAVSDSSQRFTWASLFKGLIRITPESVMSAWLSIRKESRRVTRLLQRLDEIYLALAFFCAEQDKLATSANSKGGRSSPPEYFPPRSIKLKDWQQSRPAVDVLVDDRKIYEWLDHYGGDLVAALSDPDNIVGSSPPKSDEEPQIEANSFSLEDEKISRAVLGSCLPLNIYNASTFACDSLLSDYPLPGRKYEVPSGRVRLHHYVPGGVGVYKTREDQVLYREKFLPKLLRKLGRKLAKEFKRNFS
jgi:hypothetical protein